jgi:hypothetical protein
MEARAVVNSQLLPSTAHHSSFDTLFCCPLRVCVCVRVFHGSNFCCCVLCSALHILLHHSAVDRGVVMGQCEVVPLGAARCIARADSCLWCPASAVDAFRVRLKPISSRDTTSGFERNNLRLALPVRHFG